MHTHTHTHTHTYKAHKTLEIPTHLKLKQNKSSFFFRDLESGMEPKLEIRGGGFATDYMQLLQPLALLLYC